MITNLIGAALVIMSINVQTNYCTNLVSITCEQAGCTNWFWGENTAMEYKDHTYWDGTNSVTIPRMERTSTNKVKVVNHCHTSNTVYAVSETETVTMGSVVMNNGIRYEIMPPIPLFEITTQRLLPDAQKEQWSWREEGTFFRRVK